MLPKRTQITCDPSSSFAHPPLRSYSSSSPTPSLPPPPPPPRGRRLPPPRRATRLQPPAHRLCPPLNIGPVSFIVVVLAPAPTSCGRRLPPPHRATHFPPLDPALPETQGAGEAPLRRPCRQPTQPSSPTTPPHHHLTCHNRRVMAAASQTPF